MLTRTQVTARLAPYFTGELERQFTIVFDSIRADLDQIEAHLNTLAAKLNAEAAGGVATFDTNYATITLTKPGLS